MGILIKRSAFAVGALLVWFIAESILKGYLYWKFQDDSTVVSKIMQFFPLESMSNLVKEPFSRLNAVQSVVKQIGEDLSKDFSVHWYQIAIVLFWTSVFIYSSYRILQKRDL